MFPFITFVGIDSHFFQDLKTLDCTLITQRLHQGYQDLTCSANLHFFLPIFLNRTFTNCSINKPAELSSLELPCRALFFDLRGAILYDPARLLAFFDPPHSGDQEKNLPFYIGRHRSPPLLIAGHSLNRRSEQLGHLLLRLVQFFTDVLEFFIIQGCLQICLLNADKIRA